jgi:hypothetical protein
MAEPSHDQSALKMAVEVAFADAARTERSPKTSRELRLRTLNKPRTVSCSGLLGSGNVRVVFTGSHFPDQSVFLTPHRHTTR